jgi:sulfide:quinone oxidoreductase
MARIVVLGAGIAGHTAALVARRNLPAEHEVIVVSPKPTYNWIPSNIWVGVGRMPAESVVVELAPVYARLGITFIQAAATTLHPEGSDEHAGPFVDVVRTDPAGEGRAERVAYDWLINATGPRLRFDRTPGLGPETGHTESVCTDHHAVRAAAALAAGIERLKRGERLTFVVGTGHGTCTCEGAAFEYVFNVEHELRRAGVRDRAELVFLTNEAKLGDFGVDGMLLKSGGFLTPSHVFASSLYLERGVRAILGAHVQKIEPGVITYEQLDGTVHTQAFDFAMLLPPFSGVGLGAVGRDGRDLGPALFSPAGFMKVDADYTERPYEEWRAADWPRTYQNPTFRNLFAVGIAFAPPHAISRPRKSPQGTVIAPAPPRTGMPSAVMARAVAESVVDLVLGRSTTPTRTASMTDMGAACVASAGHGWFGGTAAAMTMYPIVPDLERFPVGGRDPELTFGEVGAAGHWIKVVLHYMFMWKARANPLWWLIPE